MNDLGGWCVQPVKDMLNWQGDLVHLYLMINEHCIMIPFHLRLLEEPSVCLVQII